MSMSDLSDDYEYDEDETDMSEENDFIEEEDVPMKFHKAQDVALKFKVPSAPHEFSNPKGKLIRPKDIVPCNKHTCFCM